MIGQDAMRHDLKAAAFSPRATDVVAALAIKEGLLWRSRDDDDGAFDGVARQWINQSIRDQVLQQLILTPKIVTTRRLGLFMEGDLLADGTIRTVEGAAGSPSVDRIFPEMILGIMALDGKSPTVEELVNESVIVFRELDAVEDKLRRLELELPASLKVEDPLAPFILSVLEPRRYQVVQPLFVQLNQLREKAGPTVRAFNELENLIGLAESEQLQAIFIPRNTSTEESALDTLRNTQGSFGSEPEMAILKIATHRLGRLPHAATLKDTLTLAKTSAAEDLRNLITQWVAMIPEGPTSVLESIERKARHAMWGLGAARASTDIGRFVTYAGGSIWLSSALLNLPPDVGVSITIAGVISQGIVDTVTRWYRWASFGNL